MWERNALVKLLDILMPTNVDGAVAISVPEP
jgi:hypothetical protein